MINLRTKSLFKFGKIYIPVDLFGYANMGLPGVEIIGLGKHSRAMKEKFLYLSSELGLNLPKRRYVICTDGELEGKKFTQEEYRFLELPIYLMLWSLAGILPFHRMDDCFSSGKVSVSGEVESLEMSATFQNELDDFLMLDRNELKIIAPDDTEVIEEYYHLSLNGLLKSLTEHQHKHTDQKIMPFIKGHDIGESLIKQSSLKVMGRH